MMKNYSLLSQIVQFLEQNENSLRIKKLIFYVSKRIWEGDTNRLNQLNLYNLIQELTNSYPDIENLKKAIYKMTRTLNKSEQYLPIANTIILQLEQLYNLKNTDSKSEFITSKQPMILQQERVAVPRLNKDKYNGFEVRLKIISYTNPLRVKILLFSALDRKFDFSARDWATLRTTELNDLLQNLTHACETFPQLVSRLETTACNLDEADENLIVANTISQILKPLYT